MLGLAREAGHELTQRRRRRPTCSSSTRARSSTRPKQESIDAILEMAQLKKDGGCKRLIVTGCLAERYRDELKARFPKSTPCSARAKCRISSARIGGGAGADASPLAFCTRSARPASRPTPRRADRGLRRRPISTTPTTPRAAGDAAALRLRENRRRLRLQVRVLHHPDAARRVPQPRRRTRSSREARALAARRREGAAAHLAGHDVLRHRPRRARRAGAAAARAQHDRRPRLDSAALSLPDDDRRRRCSTRWPSATRSATTSTCRSSTRRTPVLQADEAARHARDATTRCSPASARACPASRSARPSSSAFPGETEADVDELAAFVARPRVRSRRRLHVLARGGHVGLRTRRRRARRRRRRRAGRLMALQQRIVARSASARGSASARRVIVDGPSRRVTSWCSRRGSNARRRTSTRRSILTECDPSALPARRLCSRSRSWARASYDLIARPGLARTAVL